MNGCYYISFTTLKCVWMLVYSELIKAKRKTNMLLSWIKLTFHNSVFPHVLNNTYFYFLWIIIKFYSYEHNLKNEYYPTCVDPIFKDFLLNYFPCLRIVFCNLYFWNQKKKNCLWFTHQLKLLTTMNISNYYIFWLYEAIFFHLLDLYSCYVSISNLI